MTVLFAVLFLSIWQNENATASSQIASSNSNDKVTICHREGNGGSHAITVSVHAVPAHMAHGDAIGNCSSSTISE